MKIFEVGFICKYEGGHGTLIGVEDDPFDLAKVVVYEQLHNFIEYWCNAESAVEDEYEEIMRKDNLRDLIDAKKKAIDAKTVDELRAIDVDELCLTCIIHERKVRTE